jgi:UDP-N-acetylglucosamine/UDP-N-acetylgalactosamine diphosphorylase
MTSPATDAETRRHFRAHAFFGLKDSQVVFFSQGALPALTEQGRIIRESPSRLAMAPDGNGGVYMALRAAGVLADMAAQGVEAVDCYCVDNALVRLGDPLFAGFCHSRGLECGETGGRPEQRVQLCQGGGRGRGTHRSWAWLMARSAYKPPSAADSPAC